VLARLSYHLDRPALRNTAIAAIHAYGDVIQRFPDAFARSLIVIDFLLDGPSEIAIAGVRSAADTNSLLAEVGKHFIPDLVLALGDPADQEDSLPLLRNKTEIEGRAALYLCRNYSCEAPVTDPDDLGTMLNRYRLRQQAE
jgi:uncharacterized protein YyaL (SSP411 family)